MRQLVLFVSGGLTMAHCVVALFFLRFWRDSRDRLFAFFASAFLLLALERVLVDAYGTSAVFFLVRLAAFFLIIVAIVDKNRAASQSST